MGQSYSISVYKQHKGRSVIPTDQWHENFILN